MSKSFEEKIFTEVLLGTLAKNEAKSKLRFGRAKFEIMFAEFQKHQAKLGKRLVPKKPAYKQLKDLDVEVVSGVLERCKQNKLSISAGAAELGVNYRTLNRYVKQCTYSKESSCAYKTGSDLLVSETDNSSSVHELRNPVDKADLSVSDIVEVKVPATPVTPASSTAKQSVELVRLGKQVIPMLPRELSQHQCSLNPGQTKLTVSVLHTVDASTGEIISQSDCKSVINSACKLSYETVQAVLDKTNIQPEFTAAIYNGFTTNDVTSALLKLNAITNILRQKRIDSGAIKASWPQLQFSINPETGIPDRCHIQQVLNSHSLIEELMLLTNIYVATKTLDAFPESALLRIHHEPDTYENQDTANLWLAYGGTADVSTHRDLAQAIKDVVTDSEVSEWKLMILQQHLIHHIKRAEYVCSGTSDTTYHYGLNVNCYTHFTSPIRRYADVIVHRLLDAANKNNEYETSETITKWSYHCTTKHANAQSAARASEKMFWELWIRYGQVLQAKGMVMKVHESDFMVLLPHYNMVQRVQYRDLMQLVQFDGGNMTCEFCPGPPPKLVLHFDDDQETVEICIFSMVKACLRYSHKMQCVVTTISLASNE